MPNDPRVLRYSLTIRYKIAPKDNSPTNQVVGKPVCAPMIIKTDPASSTPAKNPSAKTSMINKKMTDAHKKCQNATDFIKNGIKSIRKL